MARGRTLGALTVAWGESNRHYDRADLDLAEEMARRAALAVDNARLYSEAQRLNTELEERVRKRTAELQAANTRLEDEIDEHQRTQAEVLELQRRLMESIEAERLRLAQDLHDGPVQELYGVSYGLTGLKPDLPTADSLEQLAAMQAMLQNAIQTLRYTVGELRPPALAPFGLEKAIRSHIELFQERHPQLDVTLDLMPDGQQLPERIRLALYRVYQESLNKEPRLPCGFPFQLKILSVDRSILKQSGRSPVHLPAVPNLKQRPDQSLSNFLNLELLVHLQCVPAQVLKGACGLLIIEAFDRIVTQLKLRA